MNAILLLAVLAGGAVGADEGVRLDEVGITLPETIGAFQYGGRRDYGEGLGYSVRYGNKMCTISVFVYDDGRDDIADGKAGATIEGELKRASSDVVAAEKQGIYSNVQRMEGKLPLPAGVLGKFAADGFTFDVRGGGCKSYVLLTGYRKHFVKLRVTQHEVDGKTNDAELEEFLKTFAGHLKGPAK